jgi:hypothetical protein
MDQRPFATLSHPDSHRVHHAAAIGFPIAGLNIDMLTGKTIGAMIAVIAPGTGWNHLSPADLASECIVAGMCFVVALVKLLPFVFTIHEIYPPKSIAVPFGRNALIYLSQTSRFTAISR